jgi:tetratricopeptide (TPR) repeat protein
MAMRLGRPVRVIAPRVVQGIVEHDEAVPAEGPVPARRRTLPKGRTPANGSAPGGAVIPADSGTVPSADSGAAPSVLLRAVAATAGFTPAIRHGEAMQALGRALAEEGREADAIAALRRAVLAFRDSGDRARLAGALTDWGVCLAGAGQCEAAITAHEAAVALMREHGDWPGEGIALGNLGVALSGAGRYARAHVAFDQAAVLLAVAGDRDREARVIADREQARALARGANGIPVVH